MKKIICLLSALLVFIPVSASAATNTSSTSNFTITVVEESLGLRITGDTDGGVVLSQPNFPIRGAGTHQKIDIGSIVVSNTGNTKGKLYAQLAEPTGARYGDPFQFGSCVPGEINRASFMATDHVNDKDDNWRLYFKPEETLLDPARLHTVDTDGDPEYLGVGESLKPMTLSVMACESFPTGNLTIPVKFTLKAS